MVNAKLLVICFLIFILSATVSRAQDCAIKIKTEVKNASIGSSDGSVTFKLESGDEVTTEYLIFDVTAVSDAAGKKVAVKNGVVDRLRAGNYEFLVVDRKNQKCFKEILVQIKEQ